MARESTRHNSFLTRPHALWRMCFVASVITIFAAVISFDSPNLSLVSKAQAQAANAKDEALFLAVENNKMNDVRAAIEAGANIKARDFNGMQPVDLAIDRGFFDIAHYLISVRNLNQANDTPSVPSLPPVPPANLAATKSIPEAKPTPEAKTTPAPKATPQSTSQNTPKDVPQTDPFTLADTPPATDAFSPARSPTVADPFALTDTVKTAKEPAPAEIAKEPAPAPTDTPAPANTAQKSAPTTPPTPDTPIAADAPIITDTNIVIVDKPLSESIPLIPKAVMPEEASATKRFFTTFLDFFAPPNTTGITIKPRKRKAKNVPKPLTPERLNSQLEQLQKELGPVVHTFTPSERTPVNPRPKVVVPPSTKTYTSRIIKPKRSSPQSKQQASNTIEDPFGSMKITDTTAPEQKTPPKPKAVYDPSLPFDGGVDPDILALLDGTLADRKTKPKAAKPPPAEADPFALSQDAPASQDAPPAEADPFALGQDAPAFQDAPPAEADPFAVSGNNADPFSTPADPFGAVPTPENVTKLDAKSPPSRQEADPFAALNAPDSGNALAGLFDTPGQVNKKSGWDVKAVEGGTIPSEVPVLSNIEPTGNILEGVELTLGSDTSLGRKVGKERLKRMKSDTIHKPCLRKNNADTLYCVDKVNWPFEMEDFFLVDTIMYQGTSAISRYDAGRATNFHTLFKSDAFSRTVSYYIKRYGPPTKIVQRAIAPLAKPRQDNPTYIWQSREPGTDNITTLEVRKYDDARGSFPDINRGTILLYSSNAGTIFPQLSQLELMVLKANGTPNTVASDGPPPSVW